MKKGFKLLVIMFSIFLSVNTYAKSGDDLQIGGIYYQKIVQVKDVIADVLPPPAYIVESYLTTFLLLNEAEKGMSDKKIDAKEMHSIDKNIEYLRQLKEGISENGEQEGYFTRIEMWSKDLKGSDEDIKNIKKLLTETAVVPAREFYQILESKFIPAIKSGDLVQAKKIQIEMGEAFYHHRAVIETSVVLAKKRVEALVLESTKAGVDSKVKGPLYNEIILMKDLISDILPPPSFIIESYLSGWEMIYKAESEGVKSKAFEKLAEQEKLAESAYMNRHDYWLKNLKIKNLRVPLTETSYSPAIKFFKIYNEKFLPGLRKNDLSSAKKTMGGVMTSLYQDHRKIINQLVLAADKDAIAIQSEIAQQLITKR